MSDQELESALKRLKQQISPDDLRAGGGGVTFLSDLIRASLGCMKLASENAELRSEVDRLRAMIYCYQCGRTLRTRYELAGKLMCSELCCERFNRHDVPHKALKSKDGTPHTKGVMCNETGPIVG